MKKYTRTFKRFVNRNAKGQSIKPLWKLYKAGGKGAVLSHLQGDKVAQKPLELPPSMPKSAASKICVYDDCRAGGGNITIKLVDGWVFDSGLNMASASNVKDAIALMRFTKAKAA
jgi:hypothetical protein